MTTIKEQVLEEWKKDLKDRGINADEGELIYNMQDIEDAIELTEKLKDDEYAKKSDQREAWWGMKICNENAEWKQRLEQARQDERAKIREEIDKVVRDRSEFEKIVRHDERSKLLKIIDDKIVELEGSHYYEKENHVLTVEERDFALEVLQDLKGKIQEGLK